MENKKFKILGDGMVKEPEGVQDVAGDENRVEVNVPQVAVAGQKQEGVYKDDEQMLRNLFPEETWMRILNQLGRDDKANFANASSYFRKLLLDQRGVYLFSKVVEIMALLLEQNYDVCKVRDPKPAVKRMSVKAWKATVLKCRLVCSAWNKAVENCYEKPEMSGIPEFRQGLDHDPRSKLNNLRNIKWTKAEIPYYSPRRPGSLLHVLEHFEQSHHSAVGALPKNPFIGRYLKIKLWIPHPTYPDELTKILKRFGKEIWYLELEISNDLTFPDVPLLLFRKLRGILRLVPNLKFLQIKSDDSMTLVSSKSGKNPNIIVSSPLPKFEKLEVLSVRNLGPQIGSELIRKNRHVSFLEIIDMNEVDEDILNSLEMPNLQGLSVAESRSVDKLLEKFGPTWKNVKKLYYGHLYQETDRNYQTVVLPTVGMGAPEAFEVFQRNWAETLTELHLEHPFGFDAGTILKESKTLRLNLPGVRKLTLCVFNSCLFLDFALPLKSLEHLVFLWDYHRAIREEPKERVEMQQRIQLSWFEERMEISNIWQVFEKLKTIKMQNRRISLGYNFKLFTKEKEKFIYTTKNELCGQRGI